MSKLPIIGICGKSGSGKDTIANYIAENYNGVVISLADPLKRFIRDVFGFSNEQMWGSQDEKNALIDISDRKTEIFERFSKQIELNNHWNFLGQVLKRTIDVPDLLTSWFDHYYIKLQNQPVSIRELSQSFGTDCIRKISDQYWIDYAVHMTRSIFYDNAAYNKTKGRDRTDTANYNYIVIPDCRFKNEVITLKSFQANASTIKLTRPDAKAVENGIKNHASETEMDTIPDSFFDVQMVNDGTLDDLKRITKIAMNTMYPRIVLTKNNL